MTPVMTMAGRRVALFGLGGSGLATALALTAGGAEVLAGDDGPDGLARAREAGIATADLAAADWSGIAALVLSPGVPLTHKDGAPYVNPVVARARQAGAEVIGDVELFCRERARIAPGSPFVAVTGTNGKSTTTALIAHILREAGRDVQMGGNIGTPILALEPPAPDRVHVIEMSSFQIDLTPSFELPPGAPLRPDAEAAPAHSGPAGGPTVGVLLNVTPDHLDRHGTMEAYAAIKERLIARAADAVVGVDDPASRAVASRRESRPGTMLAISTASRETGFLHSFVGEGTRLLFATGDVAVSPVGDLGGVRTLRGRHNLQNALAALAVATLVDPDRSWEDHVEAFRTFPGLPHRLEEVARRGRVLFVNDSKATNADSTEKALLSFPGPIHWIAGGKQKAGGIAPLKPLFTAIAKAYLIGAAEEAFAVTLSEAGVPFERCGTLDRAVAAAAADAARSDAPEPVVLLSPACASYDQFADFGKRGDRFRDLVRALPGAEMRV